MTAANGEVVATSEVYRTENACRAGMESVQKNAPTAPVEDQTLGDAPKKNPKFELYRDKSGGFRFRLKAQNGRIIAVSESYRTHAGCLAGFEAVKVNAAASAASRR